MRTSISYFIIAILWCHSTLGLFGQSDQGDATKPKVGFLWMFHFNSKNNVLSQSFNDVMSDKSQQDIEVLIEKIKAFKPTKIAVERPYYTHEELNSRYHDYLKDNYTLTKEETDQIAFRLGKILGHPDLFVVSHSGNFPIDTVVNYAKAANQMGYYEKTISLGKQLVDRLDSLVINGSIIEGLKYMNSDQARKLNHWTYYPLMQVGSDSNTVGIDLVAEWYKTNMIIYNNIANIVEPGDRVLIVYGQGHSEILSDLIENSPDLELVNIRPYLE